MNWQMQFFTLRPWSPFPTLGCLDCFLEDPLGQMMPKSELVAAIDADFNICVLACHLSKKQVDCPSSRYEPRGTEPSHKLGNIDDRSKRWVHVRGIINTTGLGVSFVNARMDLAVR